MIVVALLLAQAAAPDIGARIFSTGCAVGYCHGSGGTANRGPRLRGRDFDRPYIDRVVRKGIPNSAMPGFEGRLKPGELDAVIEYVMRISADKSGGASPNAPAVAAVGEPAPKAAIPDKPVTKGEALFFDSNREVRCGTCHERNGKGTKVAVLAAGASLPGQPKNVKRIRLKDGQSFPALIVTEGAGTIRAYDLTLPPPVLRTLPQSDVAATQPETQWTHAAATRHYSKSEIDEIVRFMTSAP